MVLPNGKLKSYKFNDVIYVLQLTYNLISVTRESQTGQTVKFTKHAFYALDKLTRLLSKQLLKQEVFTSQTIKYVSYEHTNIPKKSDTKEDIWHKRYGHLGVTKLAYKKLIDVLILMLLESLPFASYPQGKQHQTKFRFSKNREDEL